MKRLVAGLGLAMLLALPSAAGASVGLPAGKIATGAMQYAGASVSIVDFAFSPSYVEIPAGGSVSWYNAGAAPHTVTSSSGVFGSGTISPGGGYGVTLTVPGTYYLLLFDPSLDGRHHRGDRDVERLLSRLGQRYRSGVQVNGQTAWAYHQRGPGAGSLIMT